MAALRVGRYGVATETPSDFGGSEGKLAGCVLYLSVSTLRMNRDILTHNAYRRLAICR